MPMQGFRPKANLNAEGVKERPAVGSGTAGRRSNFTTREEREKVMKRFFAAIMSVAVFAALAPVADAQSQCPAEVGQAKAMLQKVSKAQDVQAPRSLAGARQDVQAPRQDTQAPRSGQDAQAPRSGQETQAPRSGQDVQAPRTGTQAPRSGQDVQAPRSGQETQAPRSGQDVQAPRTGTQAPRSGQDV